MTKTQAKTKTPNKPKNRAQQLDQSSNRWFIIAIVAIFLVGSIAVLVLASNREADRIGEQTAAVTISGDSLTPLPDGVSATDPASDAEAGTVAPTLTGTDFEGNPVVIEPNGRPKAIYFLAHWCSFCQAEVPTIQELIDDGLVPDDLEVYAVSTGVDPTQANYPPETWLKREGFTPITLRDDGASSALGAFAGSSFPYAVYLDADHKVIFRTTGEQGKVAITQIWNAAAALSATQ